MAAAATTTRPLQFSLHHPTLRILSTTSPYSVQKFDTSCRFFSSGDGKEGNGDDKKTENSAEIENQETPPVFANDVDTGGDITSSPVESTEYSPDAIMKTFEDTSYYYHPIDTPEAHSQYAHMTNEELMDNSTIPGWDYLIHSPPIDKSSIPKGALVGTVVSTKMQKTVNVAVDRYKIHKKYRKRIRYTRKFMAHDENQVAREGDTVLIVPCQRISKHKHFMMREIVRAKGQL
ncbi:30S ribosomal protein S17 [Nitzschia inconspicua]|uniref:Small ribosomal subunit protein uS17c n=1 Tax=Nitzschia inconspicua TaxID=303405 RepID=A0A9K3LB57_9STRA|nr:30S ribosomal protein S17 [Nitzschia inconspicua]